MMLAACALARSFAQRRFPKEQCLRTRWLAVSLTWRRDRKPSEVRATPRLQAVFPRHDTHLHLHFAFITAGRWHMRSVLSRGNTTIIHRERERFVPQALAAKRSSASPNHHVLFHYRDSAILREHTNETQVRHTIERASRLRDLHTTRLHARHFQSIATVSRHFRLERPVRLQRETLRPVTLNYVTHRLDLPRTTRWSKREPERAAAAVTPIRTAELAWRNAAGPGAMAAATRIDERALVASHPQATASRLQQHSVEPALVAAAEARSLDAPTLDRLAEDVIRRVERRVRIARERRGV